jgi:hypothetical protein
MRIAATALAMAGMLGAGVSAGAGTIPLQDGAYEVSVRLELPHVEETGAGTNVASICVTAGDAGTHGLAALGDGNPLRNCPVSNVRHDGAILTFDIVCPGGDAAVGTARYTVWKERFEGAIAVKMGGKNMTMIERQSGRRVGACSSKPPVGRRS